MSAAMPPKKEDIFSPNKEDAADNEVSEMVTTSFTVTAVKGAATAEEGATQIIEARITSFPSDASVQEKIDALKGLIGQKSVRVVGVEKEAIAKKGSSMTIVAEAFSFMPPLSNNPKTTIKQLIETDPPDNGARAFMQQASAEHSSSAVTLSVPVLAPDSVSSGSLRPDIVACSPVNTSVGGLTNDKGAAVIASSINKVMSS